MKLPDAMPSLDIISVVDGKDAYTLPVWAKAQVWLGWWLRDLQLEKTRILAVAQLPSRSLAAAFTGLGCLMAGLNCFDGGFQWGNFTSLSIDTKVFWRSNNKKYAGVICQSDNQDSNLVPVEVTNGPRCELGMKWWFSQKKFNECQFSTENLPTPRRAEAMEAVLPFFAEISHSDHERWIASKGAEVRLLTNMTHFHEELRNLQMQIGDMAPVSLEKILCSAKIGEGTPAKLRISSERSMTDEYFPVSILDGAAALFQLRDIEQGNIAVLLDRDEYTPEIQNLLIEAGSVAQAPSECVMQNVPEKMPPGFEVAAYLLEGG